jgi:hypothetical protein
VFEAPIALAEEFAGRVERSVGKRFDDVPPADRVSRTEWEWLIAEIERLIVDTFGSDSHQMRYWKATREADGRAAFEEYPHDEWRRWLYRLQRVASTLRTLDLQVPSAARGAPTSRAPTGSVVQAADRTGATLKAFISYSHRDERHAERLRTALAVLKAQGLIQDWHDRKIKPGAEWQTAIDEQLGSADLVLLLVTPDFLASEYAVGIEVTRALERHARREAVVVPVILRACDWMNSPLGKLQALPTDGKPIANWKNRDDAWLNVTHGIRRLVEKEAVS